VRLHFSHNLLTFGLPTKEPTIFLWIDICERKPPPNVSGKALAQLRQSSGLLPNGSSTALLPGSKFEASKIKRMKSQIVEDVLMF
jgi:hypothetical protein